MERRGFLCNYLRFAGAFRFFGAAFRFFAAGFRFAAVDFLATFRFVATFFFVAAGFRFFATAFFFAGIILCVKTNCCSSSTAKRETIQLRKEHNCLKYSVRKSFRKEKSVQVMHT